MSHLRPSKRLATAEDLLSLPEERAAEVIAGELVDKASPTPDHGNAQVGLSGVLFGFRGPSGGGPRGPGGWWLMTEVEVFYETHETYRHDVAGWRRDRTPERPRDRPIRILPDWVCEILSPSNAANDTVRKLRVLHKHRVPHYWLLDPVEETLRVLRWTEQGYLEALSATADETVRAEPFEAIEIPLGIVLGLE
jgi:Uma2 family endonuclease